MEPNINDLEDVLSDETKLHDLLYAAAIRLHEALKSRALDDVRGASNDYDGICARIEHLEEKRLTISDAVAKKHGLSGHVNLSSIIEALPAHQRATLTGLRAKLRSTIINIRKISTSNSVLLSESLLSFAKTFEIIATATQSFAGYKKHGKKDTAKINRTIINTTA